MSTLFFGGMPTRPDVDKLMLLNVGPGMQISYERVSEVIGAFPRSARFKTVTDVWRKRLMREHRLDSVAEGGSFVFMTADQAHDNACKIVSRVGRAAGRLRKKVEMINPVELTGERQDRQNLLRREAQAMHAAAVHGAKSIAAPRPASGAAVRLVGNG